MEDVTIYGYGVMVLSVCADAILAPEQVAERINELQPRGADSAPWKIASDNHFATGETNPTACDTTDGRKHWLLDF